MSNPNAASRFDEIYNSTIKAVLAYITAKCKYTADISDIVQDTYMELYQVLIQRGADYVKNDKAFVKRIAKVKIARYYSLLERLKMFVSINASYDGNENEELAISDFDVTSFLMEDYAVNQVMLTQVRKLLQSKPEDVKKIFYLFYDAGLTIPEIAGLLCISESSVKNKLYRNLKHFRAILSRKGELS